MLKKYCLLKAKYVVKAEAGWALFLSSRGFICSFTLSSPAQSFLLCNFMTSSLQQLLSLRLMGYAFQEGEFTNCKSFVFVCLKAEQWDQIAQPAGLLPAQQDKEDSRRKMKVQQTRRKENMRTLICLLEGEETLLERLWGGNRGGVETLPRACAISNLQMVSFALQNK